MIFSFFYDSPKQGIEDCRKSIFLRFVSFTILLVFLSLPALFFTAKGIRGFFFQLIVLLGNLLLFQIIKKSTEIQPIAFGYIFFMFFVLAILSFFDHGIKSSTMPFFSVLLVMSGFLLSRRQFGLVALSVVFFCFFIYFLPFWSNVPLGAFKKNGVHYISSLLSCLLFVVCFTDVGLQNISAALVRLSEQNEEIEQESISKRHYESIVECIPEGMLVFNPHMELQKSNSWFESFSRQNNKELQHKKLDELFAVPSNYNTADIVKKEYWETYLRVKNGEKIPVSLRFSQLQSETTTDEIFVLVSDMRKKRTETKELFLAQQRAEKANQDKNAFLATISHELRTPLNVILGYSEMLMEMYPDKEDLLADLQKIVHSGKLLLHMVDDVLNLTNIELGQFRVEKEWIDIESLVKKIEQNFEIIQTHNQNRFIVNNECKGSKVLCDSVRATQVLNNLLSNAFKFTHQGTVTFQIFCSEKDGKKGFLFQVQDNGIGIDEIEQRKLFRSFSQANPAIQKNFGGTGLGLVISKYFAEKMDGILSLESKKGKGTTTSLWLPA